jgi:hypothetical protein
MIRTMNKGKEPGSKGAGIAILLILVLLYVVFGLLFPEGDLKKCVLNPQAYGKARSVDCGK